MRDSPLRVRWRLSARLRMPARLLLAGLLLLMAFGKSRSALERGNRLFRGGDARRAADIYGAAVDTTASGSRASYNLGTALMQIESDQVERYFLLATEGSDPAAAQRAHYNLGFHLQSGVEPDSDPFAAIPLLSGAIDHYRAALRLDPGDQNARWNLALALRAFEEVPQVFEEGPAEEGGDTNLPEDETGQAVAQSEGGGPQNDLEEAPSSDNVSRPEGFSIGARETPASGDPGPLTRNMAEQLLEESRLDDAGLMVRGLLWSQRPPPTSRNEPPPGGRW